MTKWEYRVMVLGRGDITKTMLDSLGGKGWDLISCEGSFQENYYQLIFKRPILPKGTPDFEITIDPERVRSLMGQELKAAFDEAMRE